MFEGLGLLIEHLLISHARSIRFANSFGIQKIQRNILAMQQNLKTIMDGPLEAELERAKKYYSLFSLAPAVRCLYNVRFAWLIGRCSDCWLAFGNAPSSRLKSTRRFSTSSTALTSR